MNKIWKIFSFLKPLIEKFPRVANLYRNMRDQLMLMEKPSATPWGFSLAGNPHMASGVFEPVETEIVRNILDDTDVLVNVGANIGYYCCHALSKGKAVIAFEPIQRNLRYLYQNIRVNNWSGVEIFPLAVGNSVGVHEIYGGDTGASTIKGWAGIPDSYVTLVPSSTLDIVLNNRLRGKRVLIVVDVEGAEKGVLEGSIGILSGDPKPIWMVEILTHEHQPDGVKLNPDFHNIFELFFQNGYLAFNVDREFSAVTMEQVDLIIEGTQEYTNHNYLFCDPETAGHLV